MIPEPQNIATQIRVTRSCSIANNTIELNDEVVYAEEGTLPAGRHGFGQFIKQVYRTNEINYPKFFKMDDLSKLGFIAAEVLLRNSGVHQKYKDEQVAVVLANSSASLDTDQTYQKTISAIPSPALFVYTLPNIMIGEICIRHKFKGENAFFIFDSFNEQFVLDYSRQLIADGNANAVICGWVELSNETYRSRLYLIE